LIAEGEDLLYVSQQRGHASIAVTADLYGHLLPNRLRTTVNKLDAALAAVLRVPETCPNAAQLSATGSNGATERALVTTREV